jgi:hypothetical protein
MTIGHGDRDLRELCSYFCPVWSRMVRTVSDGLGQEPSSKRKTTFVDNEHSRARFSRSRHGRACKRTCKKV